MNDLTTPTVATTSRRNSQYQDELLEEKRNREAIKQAHTKPKPYSNSNKELTAPFLDEDTKESTEEEPKKQSNCFGSCLIL